MNFHDFEVTRINGDNYGKTEKLSKYAGKTVLVVNTASKCGLTPQYKALQALQDKYGPKGFTILGFPSNDFMGQEPGSDEEIKSFCDVNYKITFPLFHKNPVKGEKKQPLYAYLIENSPTGKGEEISWNFEKFLIDSKGKIVGRYSPKTVPDAPEIVEKIEALVNSAR